MQRSASRGVSVARAGRRRRDRLLPAALLLAPSLFFLLLFTYWPVLRVLGQSLLVGRFSGDVTVGFGNYQRLFADPHFTRAAWNNLVYALGTIGPRDRKAHV